VQMALLFGSTWTVNALVFAAVLATLLAATLLVVRYRPMQLSGFLAALAASLLANALMPLGVFLGAARGGRRAGSCRLLFAAPPRFGGVVFGAPCARASAPAAALAANVAGAMAGGFAENASLLVGFRRLALLALAFYAVAAYSARSASTGSTAVARRAGT